MGDTPVSAETVLGLKCRLCGKQYPKEALNFCTDDFGPLEVTYDYDEVARTLSRAAIASRPAVDVAVPRAVARRRRADRRPAGRRHPPGPGRPAGRALGVSELYIKNDAVNYPTLSFKDRVVAVALSKAVELGFQTVGCASTGNLANSVAANAAAAGLEAYILIPNDLEQGKVLGATIYGAKVIAIEGNYDQVNRLCSQIAFRFGWGFVNVNLRPFYAEGSKIDRLRDRRGPGLARARPRRRPDGRRQLDRQDLQGVQGIRAARPDRRPRDHPDPRRPGDRLQPDLGDGEDRAPTRSSRSAIRRRSPRAWRSATRPTATSPRS